MSGEPVRWIGVLVRSRGAGEQQPPEARPVGRAALKLRDEGLGVVFGDELAGGRMCGWVAEPGRWVRRRDLPVTALHDRFASQTYPEAYQAILDGRAGLPMGNPLELTLLCRDKIASQRLLEAQGFAMPEVQPASERFAATLEAWGAGFLKPRYGALGRGVRRVQPGDALPAEGEGAVAGVVEPLFLQRAVRPPQGWSGWSLRVLVQRLPGGGWTVASRVLRRSREDPVVNVARGAEVGPAERALEPARIEVLDGLCLAVARALAGQPWGRSAVELGVDAVVDHRGAFHLIEVNSRPRGRLEALAEQDPGRWAEAHVEACARPLRYLASLEG
jgi:glutathione synthase/RimK-type ligase-like ATP-grasp enzyme